MTVENPNVRNTYGGNGSTTVFPFTFALNSEDVNNVEVVLTDTEGREARTTDFALSLNDKSVRYPKNAGAQPLPRGWKITLKRSVPYTQPLNLTSQGPFFAEDIEGQFDRQEMQIQQLAEVAGRSVTVGFGADMTPEQFKQKFFDASKSAVAAADEARTKASEAAKSEKNASDSKNSAAASASAADQSARSAGDSKNAAASSATNSARSAAASDASRQASAESESKIKNMQVDVHVMQQHVDEVKTAIDGVAARAKADGQTASNAAVQAQRSAGASAQSAAASEASAKRAEAATKYEGIVKSENLAEKSVHKKHLHQDAYESPALTGTPTVPTAGKGANNGQIASTAFVAQAIAALVNSAPGALDTLQELAQALGNDANFAATVTNALADKVSKSGDTITGALKFEENENTKISIFPGHYYHRLFGGGSITYVHAYDTLPPPRKKTMYEIRVADGGGSFVAHTFTAEGLVSNLKGKADHAGNADHLGGQSLQWIIDQINAAKNGVVASNIAPNGWVKFANGLIVQWGTIPYGADGLRTVSYPIAFSQTPFILNTSRNGNESKPGEVEGSALLARKVNAREFKILYATVEYYPVDYIALGI